ncbi:MAG: hypothetical protein J0L96_20955, partial [Anaerolineae bacterium]|nr:hypothetical protein [Anaerolineae bacterium]
MKAKRFPTLFFVFTAFWITFCRCSLDGGVPVLISFEDGTSMKCREFIDYRTVGGNSTTYDCALPCPDGSTVPFTEFSSSELLQAVAEDSKVSTTVLQNLQKQYCTAESLSKATATVTAAPTQTSTPTALPPVLTGEVTACNVPDRYINLRLAQPIFDFSTAIVTININGVSSECVVPSDNPTVLSCTLPQPITFPINIAILINGSPASSFSFEGSYCGYRDPNAPQ